MSSMKEISLEHLDEIGAGYNSACSDDTPLAVTDVDRKIGYGERRRSIRYESSTMGPTPLVELASPSDVQYDDFGFLEIHRECYSVVTDS